MVLDGLRFALFSNMRFGSIRFKFFHNWTQFYAKNNSKMDFLFSSNNGIIDGFENHSVERQSAWWTMSLSWTESKAVSKFFKIV